MLKHRNVIPAKPKRIVVLGAKGFIGGAICKQLKSDFIPMLCLSRNEVDFCDTNSSNYLLNVLQPEDVVVIAVAKAPVKNNAMLLENIIMMKNICSALQQKPDVAQVVYISSDAVYQDSNEPMDESSYAAPTSLHGVMHLAREQMLASVIDKENLLFIRPTLVFGPGDPHNGYGPNQFFRLAAKAAPIKLFGKGEELRDHIYIEDVAKLACMSIMRQSHGILNAVTSHVISFSDIAQKVINLFGGDVDVLSLPRSGPMPHNGYRAFRINLIEELLPEFEYTSLSSGLEKMQHQLESAYV
jgi:UDP-glucose 4-epimerase